MIMKKAIDAIIIEIQSVFKINKITKIMNKIYDTGDIKENFSKSIFAGLSKIPAIIECEYH